MTISKSTELKVSNETFEYAAEIASGAKDEFSRKRIYESVVCLKSLADYLKSEGYIPDINNCLYKITSLNEEIELSEFRCNGRCIDVRPVVNEKYVLIPKILFDYNILPDLFAVAEYDKKSSAVRFIGCIEPSDIVKSKQNDKYYIVDTDDLYETSEIEDCVKNVKNVKISDLNHDLYASYFIDYIDGVLSDENKKELFKHLSECKGCREKFVNFAKLENILKSAADYPQMLQDKMLNFVAATDVNSEKYKDFQEVTIEIDKEPDKYEDDDIEVNSSDPLNVLYGNKKANDEIFNNLSSQKPKSVLDSVLAEISGHSDVSEGTDKESVESENQINPTLYQEDYSDGIVDTDNKEPQGNKESSDETKEESEDEIKEEPENESYDELEYVIKEEPENESDEEPENNQSLDNNEEFDYIQDIVSPDSDIDDDNDDDNSMFVHNIADSEQATPENASKMINDDDFIPNFSDLEKYMPTGKSEESLSVDSDEVIVIDDDEENDYEKLGKMINTSNIQDFADTENESDEILIIDENENNSEDVKEINDSDKIDVTDIDIVNENEPENEPEKEQKSVNSEDDDLVLINDEETKENEDGDDLVLINDEETKENEDGDDLVLINDEETKENEDGDDLVLINDEETKENEVDNDLLLINDEETKDDNLDLINIPGLESAELSDVDSMAKDNSLFINQVSEEVTNGINNIFPDLSDDLFNNGDNRNTELSGEELSEEDSEDEDIVFINDNNDETSNNSNSGQIEISDDVLNNMTVADDNEQSELEDSVNEILSLNETVQQAADDVQVSDNKNDENEFVIIDDENDNDFETTGTFMRPASVSDINDLPEPVSLSLENDDEDDSDNEQDEIEELVSLDNTESENDNDETSDEEENNSEESEELTDAESENTDEETSDEEENESEESEELTDAESENTDEETSDEEENNSEESEELTDTESENTDEETSDEEENKSEDLEELTDAESENTDEETSDNEDNNSEEETDESENQIFEDAENSENDEEDSEEHSNEIINQIFEDRNNNSENDDEEEFEEADSEDEDSDDEYDDEISEDKSIFRKKVIAAVLASVLALAVSAGGIFWFVNKIKNNHQNNAEMSTSNEEQAELGSLDNNSGNTQLNENDSGLPGGMGNDENNMPNGEETNQAQPETSDNDALTLPDNANQEAADQNPANTASNASALNISKTAWAVAPYIASDPDFKSFLQKSGHAIQSELRQKFSSVTDRPNSDNVKIQITVKDNSSDGITVLKSSGSKQIDEIVLQSVKDYMANNQIPKLSDNAIQSLKKSNKDKKFKITFNVNF